MNLAASVLLFALLLTAASGCGDDCGSAGRFTQRNGLTVLVVCGEVQTLTPTATPTPTTPTPS